MENRFGIKDFFLFLIIGVLIVLVVLAMVQYDRQWEVMRQTNALLTEQTTDLARIHRLLEQGAVVGTTQPAAANSMAGFERVLKNQSAPDYAQGGQLRDTFQATPGKLTPLISGDLASWEIQSAVMDALVDRDPMTLRWVPRLALSWTISDDQLTIEFKLRRGATFSDGSPLTADDVVYTFDLMRNPQIEDPREKVYVEKLDRVEKVDDDTVRFVFKEPYFKSFEVAATTPIMSKAFYSKFDPTTFNRSTGLLIGSGPYRLADPQAWRPSPGEPLVVVRNERYWGPTPSFDRLVWDVMENPTARITAFRNGDTDVFGGDNGPPTPEQYDQMKADPSVTSHTNHWALDKPTAGYFYLGWNEKQGRDGKPTPFADKRVRQAMTMLTDRDTIIQLIMHNYASQITGPFPPQSPQCDQAIKPWPYDPEGAMKLLNAAGFTKQGDRLVGPDGNPMQFKIMFNSNSEPRRRIASFLRDSYAKAGILAEPEAAEWSIFLKRLDDRQFDVLIGAWSGTIEDDCSQMFSSAQSAGTGDNFIQFSDPAMDNLMSKARVIVDEQKRMPVWHQVHQMLHDDQPYTFLFIDKELDFVSDRIHGVEPTKLGLNPSSEWYIPKALQR